MVFRLFKQCCFTHVTGTCFEEIALFFNAQLKNTCSKLTIKKIGNMHVFLFKINTACHRSFVFIVDLEHSQHISI